MNKKWFSVLFCCETVPSPAHSDTHQTLFLQREYVAHTVVKMLFAHLDIQFPHSQHSLCLRYVSCLGRESIGVHFKSEDMNLGRHKGFQVYHKLKYQNNTFMLFFKGHHLLLHIYSIHSIYLIF